MAREHEREEHEASDGPAPGSLEERVVQELRTVFDPEIPVNVYELGLIYGIAVDEAGKVGVVMTLTSPSCPAAQSLPAEIERKIAALAGVSGVDLELTWDPPWSPERMTPEARLQLGLA